MEATVGIVTYCRPSYVASLLADIEQQSRRPDSVIVVDDSEDDRTASVAESHAPELADAGIEFEYVHRTKSGAIQQDARNEILERAAGDAVCFLDDDVALPEDWLAAILDAFQRNPECGSVGGPALKSDEEGTPIRDPLESDRNENVVTEYGEVVEKSGYWVPSEAVSTDVFRGANMAFRTECLEEIGGFDPVFRGPATFEEWDALVRAADAGYDLLYEPEAAVYHLETEDGGSRAKLDDGRPGPYWYGKNDVIFRRKNFEDTYYRSLVRLALFTQPSGIDPLWKQALKAALGDDVARHWLRGYVDGVRSEVGG